MGNTIVNRDGPATVCVTAAGQEQAYVTASLDEANVGPALASQAIYGLVAEVLAADNLHIVHERIFGSIAASREVMKARGRVISSSGMATGGPATYVQGRPCWGDGLAGVCIHAVRANQANDNVWPIHDPEGQAVGCGWRRHGVEFLIFQNMHGLNDAGKDNSLEVQAARMFDRAETALRAHGATYRDVVRTWIYLADILDWYDQFNTARNERYRQFGIMPDLTGRTNGQPICLPASTGIEGGNPMAAACVMDVLAVVAPPELRPGIEQMTNVKQEDAFMYGSAFSRGAYLREPDVASILISGTAAIDENGRTLHPDDPEGQIRRTFDNVEALIGEKGATLRDICEANVFLKRAEYIDIYRQLAAERGLEHMPAVCINADICRVDLLFEMDGVALIPS